MTVPQGSFRPQNWKFILRFMRSMHFCFLGASIVQVYVLYLVTGQRPAPQPQNPVFSYVFTAVGSVDLIIAVVVRTVLLRTSLDLLRANAMDLKGQTLWRTGTFVSSLMAYSIFLLGFVLAFLDGVHRATILLWLIAAVAFFLFIPQSPIDESANVPEQN